MKRFIKLQLKDLKNIEKDIKYDLMNLTEMIFIDHLDYEIIDAKRNALFTLIDKIHEKYKAVFTFDIYYSETQRYQNIKYDVNRWIEQQYETEQE